MSNCLYPERKVRKTINHCGSVRRPQHFYCRLTEAKRRQLNSIIGGFKHFEGPNATGADIIEKYGIPAMAAALKDLADKKRNESNE